MSRERAHSAYRSAETLKKLSDRVIGFGPFGIGLDGVLTWIPGAGLIYSVGASLFLAWSALRAGASVSTLAKMAGFLGIDMLLSPVPVVGDFADMLWQGHLMAATALQKDIETRHGAPDGLDSVLRRPRRRRTGLGLVALFVLVGMGAAVWRSDFADLTYRGWRYAAANADIELAGATLSLWMILAVGIVLLFALSTLRARLQKRREG